MQRVTSKIRDQRGFTLIEIIMVIVLLGIIAAIAIPKYIDLRTDAQDATADGIVGAIVSSAAIGYADRAVKGTNPVTYPSITDLQATYLRSQKVTLVKTAPTSWTAKVGAQEYTFTYTQLDGGAGWETY
jgi:prepilin-type N-terminal cleavage/methylation domain-containing protein